MALGLPESYWLSLNAIETPAILGELDIPMLIMQGGADFQVSAENDFGAFKELLKGRENVEFKLYEGLNHLFMPTSGKRDLSEYEAKSNVAVEPIEDIARFINE